MKEKMVVASAFGMGINSNLHTMSPSEKVRHAFPFFAVYLEDVL
jgi:hypothetical protein